MRTNLSSKITMTRIPRRYYQPDDVFELSRVTRLEKIPTEIFDTEKEGSAKVAEEIAALIKTKQAAHEKCVLGLTSGKSMVGIYAELVRLHKKENLSFNNVVVFLLFEYYPLTGKLKGSYGQLKNMLLDHVDIPAENIFYPDGTMDKHQIMQACAEYEQKIAALGGIDLQLLGIGRSGNIGFNEPGSLTNSQTRLILLDTLSREDAAEFFSNAEMVPVSAITLGISTILKAKRIVLVAWGEHKSTVVKNAVEGPMSETIPASYLQLHSNVKIVIDLHAASELTRISMPWLVTSCEWDSKLIRRAIVWLCMKLKKPILKLTNKDYNDNGLSELLAIYGSAYNVNIRIFNDLQHTITGWPGGKPNADDSNRPERALPYPKRVLIFSPHPDDDVISMGGTFKRLIDQNHKVHVAYQTSGNIAVADHEVIRFLSFVKGFKDLFDSNNDVIQAKYEAMKNFLLYEKKENDMDTPEILEVKALIRRGEAKAACRYLGLSSQNIHFLNLPFYETGTVKKNDLSQKDIDIIKDLLQQIQPHQIYAAGDLADPHGTHKICLDAVLAAIDELKDEEWMKDCRVWMYRGAWKEWEIDHIEMAVPLSPEELKNKRNAILRHQSQMESAPYLGNDERLFWQRSEERNRATAELYTQLGLASYEAIEAFVRYKPV
ncbi:MAG TPA: glucosamine-6-phosphate deaminase [Paludibacteraceae bacterium]|nr:glucosamine-6-phosphate deaminase [Paludibacteraceae bacterium]HOL29376.1 glucosamine-6-phosphate deaminase [Paludibacteraceae bacterium]HON02104.1 glucosamine-6-phosphate deaminase [Paludibacteraceae bacterium]HPQ13341.1 glucosamine-6-phosphate deaminase [Paludibacteraceae bacterium]